MNTKSIKNRWMILFLILTVLWMGFIFYMSAQPASESARMSGTIGERIARFLRPDYASIPTAEWQAYVSGIDHIVRKTAHLTEYLILGVLLSIDMLNLWKRKRSPDKSVRVISVLFFAWLIGAVYAASDEFHQFFVEGRSMEALDVGIDSLGVCIGCCLVGIFLFIVKRHTKKECMIDSYVL